MKKIKFLVASIIAGSFVFLSGAVSPFLALAESVENGSDSNDIVTNEEIIDGEGNGVNLGENNRENVIIGNTYKKETGSSITAITIIDKTTVRMDIYIRGNYVGAVDYVWMPTGENIITLILNGTVQEEILLKNDGTYETYTPALTPEPEQTPDTSSPEEKPNETPNETPEENLPNEMQEITFDDILAFVGKIAEKEGFSDEWEKALHYIKTAASEKKVDVMILVGIITYISYAIACIVKVVNWVKKRKNDTTNDDLNAIKTTGGLQTSAINSLIDEEGKVAGKVDGVSTELSDCLRREKALAEGIAKQNVAIRALIRGTNIKQDLKDEAFRALNDSDDKCDEAKK